MDKIVLDMDKGGTIYFYVTLKKIRDTPRRTLKKVVLKPKKF